MKSPFKKALLRPKYKHTCNRESCARKINFAYYTKLEVIDC